jgi:hypothetical protein
MRPKPVVGWSSSVALGPVLASISFLFHWLTSLGQTKNPTQLVLALITSASVWLGTRWILMRRTEDPAHTVFTVIGTSIICATISLNSIVTLYYTHVMRYLVAEGPLYAIALVLNSTSLLLLFGLPIFQSFASSLSRNDSENYLQVLSLFDQLTRIEDDFLRIDGRWATSAEKTNGCPITLLREQSSFLTPIVATIGPVCEADHRILKYVSDLTLLVAGLSILDIDAFANQKTVIAELCHDTLAAMRRRERQLIL